MLNRRYLKVLTAFFILMFASVALAGDPSGTSTGGIADVPAATAGQPTMAELAAQVGHNKIGINFVWVLITGFLVFFMQAGFALVETGLTRAKNAAHTMAMTFRWLFLGRLFCSSAGSALTPEVRWPEPTCAFLWSQ